MTALDAFAYIDPTTGSYIFQAIITIVLTAAFVLKSYWQRLRAMFLWRRKGGKDGTRGD